ncbi:MAG: chemotaxis-specific protein-glutamate methyltransferase CheB [Pseudomonadota bacterium]
MLQLYDQPGSVRVVIVDDTRTIRAMIRTMLEAHPRIEVVGEAGDPYEAREVIRELNPDVITLDIAMPRMDGLSFLERLMRLRPMPVIMVSSRTTANSQEAIAALSLGAVDCVDLGQLRKSQNADALAQLVLMAGNSNLVSLTQKRKAAAGLSTAESGYDWNGKVVLIGSSTGGVDALLQVLSSIPPNGPPIVIAQHMPASFLESFAARLSRNSQARVVLSEDGIKLEQGCVYLGAGGDMHTVLARRDPFRLNHVLHDGSERYVPSVNLLFSSAVPHAKRVVGVMLTGMGNDGAGAMLRMREAGAHTIAQDAASAVVDGMPKSAREIGAATEVACLSEIGGRILAVTSKKRKEGAT